ncbi:MAG: hypothetical protein Q9163_006356 [Psora crenata]
MAANTTEPWASNRTALAVSTSLHYICPVLLLVVFVAAFIARSILTSAKVEDLKPPTKYAGPGGKPLPRTNSPAAKEKLRSEALDFSPGRKLLFTCLSAFLLLTFVGNAVVATLHALTHREEQWWCGQSFVANLDQNPKIYVVATFFVYSLVFISIIDTKPSPTEVHAITWSVGLILEMILFASSAALYTAQHRELKAFDPEGGPIRYGMTTWESVEIVFDLIRILSLCALLSFYALFVLMRYRKAKAVTRPENGVVDERTSLLDDHSAENGNANGKVQDDQLEEAQPEDTAGWVRPDKLPSKTWWEYVRGYSLFFPYLWPAKSRQLQLIVLVCFILLLLARAVNVMVPIQAGKITDLLTGKDGQAPQIPWLEISLYILYRLLQGGSGFINCGRAALWIPISQYSYRELSVAAFEHVHSLSLDFHLGKKTGEVLSALNKGNSINSFLEQVTFQVLPMIVDLAIAIVYFVVAFDIYFALIVTLVAFSYMYITVRLAQWRTEIRRDVTNLGRNEEAVKYVWCCREERVSVLIPMVTRNDSMVSYETVKYFNAERYEFDRYRGTVNQLQKAEYTLLLSLNIMNVAQNLCFTIGLMASCFLAAFQISIGQRQVGQFVALLTYMAQLQGPLNFFGTFYRMMQTSMINAERMLELFREQPTVVDKPGAGELPSCQGEIRFRDVKFAYDPRRPALKGLNFVCAPGSTTALVGESGGGKSTVFRLLFRFYNIGSGNIEIDGRNVEDITIDSFRRHIGVVPQDTVLFNETIMYNLKYANQKATNEDVYEACRAASIHEQILKFPDGYQSRVGERGLKLSGGEKQRVAIARTILKDPRIILLDEATAALDSETEQHIQNGLVKLSQGRTTLVIAHRLSTITNADQILVLHQGKVAESGTHEELLALEGRYATMWNRQIRAQQAAADAREANNLAKQLRREAQGEEGDSSANQSEDEGHGGNKRGRPPPEIEMTGSMEHDDQSGMPHGHP